MKKYLNIIPWILCLLLVIYIGQCTHRGESKPVIEYKDSIVTTHTTDKIKVKGDPVPYPIAYQVIDTFILSQNVDTLQILAEYIKLRKYNLPVTNDSNSKINVFADVQYNSIINWTYKAEIYPHSTIIEKNHVIVTPARRKLSAGLILNGNAEYFGASPSLMLQTKKNTSLVIGYDVINNNYSVGAFVKIGKR